MCIRDRDNLELQLTNRAHDAAAVELVDEELRQMCIRDSCLTCEGCSVS